MRLADWMRKHLPDIKDEHLYTIESHIHRIIKENNLCIKSMMKDETCRTHSKSLSSDTDTDKEEVGVEADDHESNSDNESTFNTSSGHSSKVANKKLRCVKV